MHLKRDVLLLASMFEKFKNNTLKNYGLCQSYYMSAPVLSLVGSYGKSWAEFISDTDIYLFFEKKYERWGFLHF